MKNNVKRFQSLNDMYCEIKNDDKILNDLKQILYYRINEFIHYCNTMKYTFKMIYCEMYENDDNIRMYELNYFCKINNVTHKFISLYDDEFICVDDKMII